MQNVKDELNYIDGSINLLYCTSGKHKLEVYNDIKKRLGEIIKDIDERNNSRENT